jgi:hypothetical protein
VEKSVSLRLPWSFSHTTDAMHPNGTVRSEQIPNLRQTISHHCEPDRVLQSVVVVLEGLASVEGWI